jgi:hypothetical protein
MKNINFSGYNFGMESLFGELIINGENPYCIKKLEEVKESSN